MNIDLPFILLFLCLTTFMIWLVDRLLFHKHRLAQDPPTKTPIIVDWCGSLFPIFIIVLLIRSFIFQPYHVISGSLEPSVKTGDLVLVNQFAYGLRLPLTNKKIMAIGEPKRGDIVLFHWPVNRHMTFVKRVIGLPGDHINYINKVLYINGKRIKQKLKGHTRFGDTLADTWPVNIVAEQLGKVDHNIYICPVTSTQCPNPQARNFTNLVVPQGEYFMMGDNRDDSDDSRDWGFVPETDILGKGEVVLLNWSFRLHHFDWHRIGTIL